MAKGKRNKGKAISLQNFLATGNVEGTVVVTKILNNLDDDDSDDESQSLTVTYELPTAPKASRIFDDASITHEPPFIAHLSNLPFDANEDDIYDFFETKSIISLRLPREDGETGRVRGFGYVEFESRVDLIDVLSLPDPSIKGRSIRIELSSKDEKQNNKRGYNGFGNDENRDSTNWRRDSQNQESGGDSYRARERGYNGERKSTSEEDNAPGSWRNCARSIRNVSPQKNDRKYGRQWNDNSSQNVSSFSNEDDSARPKLKLNPRTLALPIILTKEDDKTIEPTRSPSKSVGTSPEKVFGSAKPVNTAARELEIESRRQKSLRQEQEMEQTDVNDNKNEENSDLNRERKRKSEEDDSPKSWRNTANNLSPKYNGQKYERQWNVNRSHNVSSYRKEDDSERPRLNLKPRTLPLPTILTKVDEKTKDKDSKINRDVLKDQPNQSEPISSNKNSGLDDDASE